jgi:hypothetical protein
MLPCFAEIHGRIGEDLRVYLILTAVLLRICVRMTMSRVWISTSRVLIVFPSLHISVFQGLLSSMCYSVTRMLLALLVSRVMVRLSTGTQPS